MGYLGETTGICVKRNRFLSVKSDVLSSFSPPNDDIGYLPRVYKGIKENAATRP
ncbi:hypothetical protein U14_04256 [Candidatus Moduliflexus flocculans]|uniref:Uncharacterized protein n=1 Tax=Candidatus Moduliflexus flocculans TaxID=1499966 RepID=A0A0S6W065_9BACT|nr:hypothetical protein U14_04256 [Candidatus Moduliflexus flocculans]